MSIWHCDPNAITCRSGHVFQYLRAKYAGDMGGYEGHGFLACLRCDPHEHFFVLRIVRPSPLAICYLISEDCYRQWNELGAAETPATLELLYLLTTPDGQRHNPQWRPRQ